MKILFVCLGNICRSPMAERVARTWFAREGVDAQITSAGTSDEERGNPIDPRAVRVLRAHGYTSDGHAAHQITAAELASMDLVVCAEARHINAVRRLAPAADVRLISSFDPSATPGEGLPDPWYGGPEGFDETLAAIERAMPALVDEVRRRA